VLVVTLGVVGAARFVQQRGDRDLKVAALEARQGSVLGRVEQSFHGFQHGER
jgi:hypothetical protein